MPSARISPSNEQHSIRSKGTCPVDKGSIFIQETEEPELNPYQRIIQRLNYDESWQRDIVLGRRIGFYKLKGELGTGNFSKVKSAIHCLTKERVAIKILDKSKLDQKTQRMLSREIISMESLHHVHIIRLFEVMETMSKIFLVMEHASGGELFHRISSEGRFSEQEAKPIVAQIIDAVDHMHAHNIIHRDLKAENVFFSSPGHVKVGDFGFSTQIRYMDEALQTFCGSPPYAAPELFQDDSYKGSSVDVWALGVLLYFMLTATMPFKSQTVSGLKKLIIEGQFTVPDFLSMDCQFLIYGLLRKNPLSRHSVQQIKKSRWLSKQPVPSTPPDYSFQPPSFKQQSFSLSKEELVARTRLEELGITEDLVEDAWNKGVKSNVTGTYRILLHYLTHPRIIVVEDVDAVSMTSNKEPSCVSIPRHNKREVLASNQTQNKKSRTCTIL